MTIEHYYIRAYWGARKESAEECARNLRSFLRCPALSDIGYNHWYGVGNSRKEALQREITFDIPALEQFLLSGRNYTDFGHKVMEELGFLVSLWSTIDTSDDDIGIMLQCGCYAQIPGVNSCVIDLPSIGRTAERLLRISVLQTIIECIVSAWSPDWAVVSSREYQKIEGKLIISTEERFTVNNPSHVEAAIQVTNRLAQAGLLEPLA